MTINVNMKTEKAKMDAKKRFVIDENIKQFFPKVSPMGGINPNEGAWVGTNSIAQTKIEDQSL